MLRNYNNINNHRPYIRTLLTYTLKIKLNIAYNGSLAY